LIALENLTKIFWLQGQRKVVLEEANAVFPSRVGIGLLGRNGAGKSTLLQLIGGSILPTSGRILSDGRISFPVGFAGSFHPDMTGAQNVRFVARIYGVDTDDLIAYVKDFAELGKHFYLPIRSYSSGMRSRLTFGLSMGLKFDTYLIDEVTAVGDAAFVRKSEIVLAERLSNSGTIFVSHSMGAMRRMCNAGAVLEGGKLTYYPEIEEAIAVHEFNMRR
jgi:capsular polysaccharide transport system ATP-binding protein